MTYLPATALTAAGINASKLDVLNETHFEGPRPETLYQSPLVLIKKNEVLPIARWDDGAVGVLKHYCRNRHGNSNGSELENVQRRLTERHRMYPLSCVLHASKQFVAKATAILKQDIDALPFPDDPAALQLSFWDEVLQDDVLDHLCDFIRLGQNSALLKEAADASHLSGYSKLFCRMLGTVYSSLEAGKALFFDGLICQIFRFGRGTRDDG